MAAVGRGRGRGRGLLAREAPSDGASKPGGLANGDEKVNSKVANEIFGFELKIT